mgnify:CR=1 FL=1
MIRALISGTLHADPQARASRARGELKTELFRISNLQPRVRGDLQSLGFSDFKSREFLPRVRGAVPGIFGRYRREGLSKGENSRLFLLS